MKKIPYMINVFPSSCSAVHLEGNAGGWFLLPHAPNIAMVEVTDEWWEEHKDLPSDERNAELGKLYKVAK